MANLHSKFPFLGIHISGVDTPKLGVVNIMNCLYRDYNSSIHESRGIAVDHRHYRVYSIFSSFPEFHHHNDGF